MIRLLALLIVTVATLAVSWVLYQDDHGNGALTLFLGVLFFVAPGYYVIVGGDQPHTRKPKDGAR